MGSDLSWLVGELRALAGDLSSPEASGPLVLAIDQGGHASRALVFDHQGRQVAESFAPISTFRQGADRVEHDPREVLESLATAIADVRQALAEDAARVVAAGLATQRSSIVCWDRRTGEALSPVVSWQDRRNAALVEKLRHEEAAIRSQTGLPLSPHYGASKLRWCLDEIEAVREARRRQRLALGPVASFILSSLAEEHPHLVDPATASRTQLLDVATRDWSTSLTALFGVPRELLPRCVASRHLYGHMNFADRRVPIIVSTGDQSAMPFAAGGMQVDTVYLNVGTGAFLQRMRVENDSDDPKLLRSLLWSDERHTVSVMEGTVNGAGSAIDWLNERIGIDTHRAALSMTRRNLSETPPVFMNGVSGVGSPWWLPQLESRFLQPASEASQVAGVIESIAFLIAGNFARMRGAATRRIAASGGLSASNYLCECVATLCGVAVERTSLRESTATGLAYLVAGQPADWQPQAQVTRFVPEVDAALAARHATWRAAMEAEVG
jgi:glycerol kinase